MPLMPEHEIEKQLASLPGWARHGDALVKQFTFSGFPDAVAFVNRLVPGAAAADHHPDITINYRRVTLSFSTHSEGGITEKDVVGASEAERLSKSQS